MQKTNLDIMSPCQMQRKNHVVNEMDQFNWSLAFRESKKVMDKEHKDNNTMWAWESGKTSLLTDNTMSLSNWSQDTTTWDT